MKRRTPPHSPAGEFEVLVLLGVLRAGDEAYGSRILAELEERSGRAVARGALYVTLDRLERKGFLVSRTDDAAPVRGGRKRRYYTVQRAGIEALRHSLAAFERMREGLKLGLKQS